jgi:hypothetical protein
MHMIPTRTQNDSVWQNFFLPQHFVWLFMSQQIKNFLLPLSIAVIEHTKHIQNTVTTNERSTWGWTFINRCLSKIFNILWPNVLLTEALWRCTQDKLEAVWTKLQKWKYAGHKMRKDSSTIANKALSWNPQGQWSSGRKTKKRLQNNRGGRWNSVKD